MKAVEEKNRREMNFFSQGWGEDYRDLLESVPYRRRAGKYFSDCMGTKLHMYTTNYKLYFPSHTEKQAVQVAQNKLESKAFKCCCQITQFSNMWTKIEQQQEVDSPEAKLDIKWDMTEQMFHLLIRGCTNAFQLQMDSRWGETTLILGFPQYCAEILSNINSINTGKCPVCICVCVYMCLRVCMCVHIYCMYISSFTTVMSIPNIERNRIGRADDGSKFCVQSPLESPGQKKRATKTQISCKILTRIAA